MALEAARGGSLFLLIQAELASRVGLIQALDADGQLLANLATA
jgi:hypothetical protein